MLAVFRCGIFVSAKGKSQRKDQGYAVPEPALRPRKEGWIEVIGWDNHQREIPGRRMVWVKNHIRLMAKQEYLQLSYRHRGILHGIWMLYAESGRQLGASPVLVGLQLGDTSVRTRDIEVLVDAGFLAINVDKMSHQRREEKRREEPLQPAVATKTKSPRTKTPLKPRERDEVWDWLVALRGEPLDSQRAMYGKAAADLSELLSRDGHTNGSRATELTSRRTALVREWNSEGKATVHALIKHWTLAGTLKTAVLPDSPEARRQASLDGLLRLKQERGIA